MSNIVSNTYKTPNFDIIDSMLKLTILVYRFQNNFTFDISNNSSQLLQLLDIDSLNIGTISKNVLKQVLENSPNGKLVKFFNTTFNVQCGITISHIEKRISIVFRGSDSLQDWIYDFLIIKKNIGDGKSVHYGFYRQLFGDNLYKKILLCLNELVLEHPEYGINIVGHSLGGGLATILSYYLVLEDQFFNKNIIVVTFGSPRVGNYSFMECYNNIENIQHYRVVNQNDIVCSVPYFNYYHVGQKIMIDKNCATFFDCNYQDSLNIFYQHSPHDHLITEYYQNLNTCKW